MFTKTVYLNNKYRNYIDILATKNLNDKMTNIYRINKYFIFINIKLNIFFITNIKNILYHKCTLKYNEILFYQLTYVNLIDMVKLKYFVHLHRKLTCIVQIKILNENKRGKITNRQIHGEATYTHSSILILPSFLNYNFFICYIGSFHLMFHKIYLYLD